MKVWYFDKPTIGYCKKCDVEAHWNPHAGFECLKCGEDEKITRFVWDGDSEHPEWEEVEMMISIEKFIEDNRDELLFIIKRMCPNCSIEDDDIEDWVNNDEGLYIWSVREGVDHD